MAELPICQVRVAKLQNRLVIYFNHGSSTCFLNANNIQLLYCFLDGLGYKDNKIHYLKDFFFFYHKE